MISKPDFELNDEYLQLALDMDLPEVELEHVSPEEARLRSEAARKRFEDQGTSEEYRMLRDEGWPWRQAAYIMWAAMPKPRSPETQEQLAKEVLGLASDRAINMWRKKNPMIDDRVAMLQAKQLWEARPAILAALAENASKADYKTHNDRKLALEMLGDYQPSSKLTAEMLKSVSTHSLDDLSDDELSALSAELRKKMEGGK